MGNPKKESKDSSLADNVNSIHSQANQYDIELGRSVEELLVSQFQMEKLR